MSWESPRAFCKDQEVKEDNRSGRLCHRSSCREGRGSKRRLCHRTQVLEANLSPVGASWFPAPPPLKWSRLHKQSTAGTGQTHFHILSAKSTKLVSLDTATKNRNKRTAVISTNDTVTRLGSGRNRRNKRGWTQSLKAQVRSYWNNRCSWRETQSWQRCQTGSPTKVR